MSSWHLCPAVAFVSVYQIYQGCQPYGMKLPESCRTLKCTLRSRHPARSLEPNTLLPPQWDQGRCCDSVHFSERKAPLGNPGAGVKWQTGRE